MFVDVLYGLYLLDSDYYDSASFLFSSLVSQLSSLNRRTLDALSAKVYYFYALCHERWGEAESTQSGGGSDGGSSSSRLSSILPTLLASYRTCCLQHNEPGQAVLINCILRSYLSCRQYALADTFRLKSAYPSDLRLIPAAVYARYCLSEDSRVLTDKGFLFLDEVLGHLELDDDGETVLASSVSIACYNAAEKRLEYHPPTQFILKPHGRHSMVEFAQEGERRSWSGRADEYGLYDGARPRTNRVSLLVTDDHDMYAQKGVQYSDGSHYFSTKSGPVQKVKAHALLSNDSKAICRLQAVAEAGVHHAGYQHDSDSKTKMKATAVEADTDDDEDDLAEKEELAGLTTQEVARRWQVARSQLPFIDALSLQTMEQVHLFLELYGFWLGDGFMEHSCSADGLGCLGFAQRKETDIAWLLRIIPQLGVTDMRVCPGRSQTSVFIYDPCWFRLFDAEYGRKYSGSIFCQPPNMSSPSTASSHAARPSTPSTTPSSIASNTRSRMGSVVSGSGIGLYSMDYDAEVISCQTPGCSRDSFERLCDLCVGVIRTQPTPAQLTSTGTDVEDKEGEDEEPYSPSSSGTSERSQPSEWSQQRDSGLSEDESMKSEDEEPSEPDTDTDKPEEYTQSAKWFWGWVIACLSRMQMRRVLRGLRRADGSWRGFVPNEREEADEDTSTTLRRLFTSCPRFRDELVAACLHAGFAVFFRANFKAGAIRGYNRKPQNGDFNIHSVKEVTALSKRAQKGFEAIRETAVGWTVLFSRPAHPTRAATGSKGVAAACTPILVCKTDVRRVSDYTGRVWCVTVPHGLIVAQRAKKNDEDVVTYASRPVIVGNCYYVGKIHAVQLAYSDAFNWLQQAKRKAPAGADQAVSFKYQVQLLAVITQLLMGEIPERSAFNDDSSEARQLATVTALTRANSLGHTKHNLLTLTAANGGGSSTAAAGSTSTPSSSQSSLPTATSVLPSASLTASPPSHQSLYPYLCLTRAVRVGDLALFQSVSARFSSSFARDDVSSLIVRLRANVIKAGLRRINLSYSAIPLQQIEDKLRLDDAFKHDGEALVVKAISDGVIDATLDPATAALHSTPTRAVYSSSAPQQQLHKRITFALDVHTDAVRALTYPHAASNRAAATGEQYDEDDDDEDSLAALQRRERREKEKEKDKDSKDKEKEGKDAGQKDGKSSK